MPFFTVRGPTQLAAPAGPTTLTNAAPTLTLSGGNLTATANANTGDGANARSSVSHATGKYYFEVTVTATGNTSGIGFGVMNSSELNTHYTGETANSIGIYDRTGSGIEVINNNATVLSYTQLGFPTGTTFGIAVDVDNRLLWWTPNGDATHYFGSNAATPDGNPSTGINGLDISAVTGALFAAVEAESLTQGQGITINFHATSYTYVVPTAFLDW